MKTLADFKRALIVGSVWNCKHIPSGNDLGNRAVVTKKTNSVGFDNGRGGQSWHYFEKSENYKFNENIIEVWGLWYCPKEQDSIFQHILTYTLISE